MSTIQLRPHQSAAYTNIISAITTGQGSTKGRVVIPTGGGKTFLEAAVLDYMRGLNKQSKIHLVLAPRILLTNQLIEEFRKFSAETYRIMSSYRIMAFHSGSYEPECETIPWKEHATTVPADIITAFENASKCGQDLVVFSTYHSCGKLADLEFETLIADESQYCVTENFNDSVKSLNAKVKLFFTATEKFTSSTKGRGLNNTSVYGERLYYISPAELVELGLIVPPRLHVMYADTINYDGSVISEVIELAVEQHKLTHTEMGFSKILFAMKGTDDVKTVEDNIAKLRQALPNHDIFTITSKTGAKVNGVKVRRPQFLKELKDHPNCLIFHYDILSEGIDVDGITGVALMRNLGLSKLLQTIGRAVRVYKPNPALKKQAWISVSVINGDEDDKERVKYFVNAIRNGGFDISAEDVVETGKARHSSDNVDVDDAYTKDKLNKSAAFLTDVFHEVEDDIMWNNIHIAEDLTEKLDIIFEGA